MACGRPASASQSYLGDIRLGDVVNETTEVEHVSVRRNTRLGPGYLVTLLTRFANQTGDAVDEQRITVLAYVSQRPGPDAPPVRPASPSPAPSEDHPCLPPFSVTLDRLGIIACANACGNFAAGHYDPDVARAHGFEDIFTDVYSSIAFAHRYVAGWAGPPPPGSRKSISGSAHRFMPETRFG